MGKEISADQPKTGKPRADTLRNRELLLSAAAEVFREDGGRLEAVARKAGLGIGTLYRHFPTREALFQAVYAREVEILERRAEEDSLEQFLLAFDSDLAPMVGQQVTLDSTNAGVAGPRIDEMITAKRELSRLTIRSGENWLTDLGDDELFDLFALRDEAVSE